MENKVKEIKGEKEKIKTFGSSRFQLVERYDSAASKIKDDVIRGCHIKRRTN